MTLTAEEIALAKKAHDLAPGLVTEAALPFAEMMARGLGDESEPESDVEMLQYILDSLFLALHLIDRLIFAELGAGNRNLFMDSLLPEIAEGMVKAGVNVQTFRQSYNEAQVEFSKYPTLLSEPPKGSLFWEWGKRIAMKHKEATAADIVFFATNGADYLVALSEALRDIGVLARK